MNEIIQDEIIQELINQLSNIQTVGSIGTYLKNIIQTKLSNEPEFIKNNVENAISEAIYEIKNDADFNPRPDWFGEHGANNISRILYRTLISMINDIQGKKNKHIGYFWKNIMDMKNSRIDTASSLEYFDIIDSISYRNLCYIKFVIEYNHGYENSKWEYDPINQDLIDEKIKQMNEDDQHKFHNISREMINLKHKDIITGVQPSVVADNRPVANHMLMADLTYLGKDLYNLMELNKIPNQDIIDELSLWSVRPKP